MILNNRGLRYRVDFSISGTRLIFKTTNMNVQLLSSLKEIFPEFNYYWETPKILVWF